MSSRKIIHVDMDAFYASVEMRDHPSLRSRPIAVGGDPESRGVIATANYKARKFGVRSAMPSWKAKKLCPDLLIIFPNFHRYKEESEAIHVIFNSFTDQIEPLSLDEAFLDVSGQGSATLIAKEIRARIFKERGLTASAGVAPNKFLAKVASDWKKPNGLFVITPEEVDTFMKTLPIAKIPGIGQVTAKKFQALNIQTCGELQELDLSSLHDHFGKRAWDLHQLCRGIDERPVCKEWIRKSLSVESTFSHDLVDLESCLKEIPELYASLMTRYRKIEGIYHIRKPFIKIKFSNFTTTTVENVLAPLPTIEAFNTLLQTGWERKREPVRLLGVGLSLHTDKETQLTLF